MNIEYLYTGQYQDSVQVDNIGETYLSCYNDIGDKFCLSIHTKFGYSTIIQFGPLHEVTGSWNANSLFTVKTIEFSQQKIVNEIGKFINTPKFMITQVVECTPEEFKGCLNEYFNSSYKLLD